MKGGTTQPARSEDLWAQVATPQQAVRTQRRMNCTANGEA